MSIASEITRLQGVKADILTAIADKGVTVPAGSALDDCPSLIGDIEQGGGGNVITIGGEDYGFVRIGNLLWTTRNLNLPVTHSVANDSHPEYGRYYGLNTGFASEVEAQLTDGWHVPTQSDFKSLCNSFNDESSGAWAQVAYILRNSNWTDLQGAKQGVDSVGFAANQCGVAYVSGGTVFIEQNGAYFASKEGYYELTVQTGTNTAYVGNGNHEGPYYLSVRLCCIPYTK